MIAVDRPEGDALTPSNIRNIKKEVRYSLWSESYKTVELWQVLLASRGTSQLGIGYEALYVSLYATEIPLCHLSNC